MAEETNAEVLVAEITSMYGLGSDGFCVILSMCSPVSFCSHQFIFPCLQIIVMFFQGTNLHCAISCKALLAHNVDVNSLHISDADIFISRVRVAGGSQCRT